MELIKRILFGRKIKINDNRIGELSSRIKSDNLSVEYTWYGEYKLIGQNKVTAFYLNGNCLGPYSEQLRSVHRVVDTLNDIFLKIDVELKKRQDVKDRFKIDWRNDFYLAAIYSDIQDSSLFSNRLELSFEALDDEDLNAIGLIWQNDKLIEIEIY